MFRRTVALIALASLAALPGCVTTTTESRTWFDPGEEVSHQRRGRVDSVREIVQRQRGNPAGGAVAGAIIGGLIGSTIGGHGHYDRWGYRHNHGNPAGAVVGAIGGAAVGAAASQGGGAENRWYEVYVRFEDGGYEMFTYRGSSPFQPGDTVVLGARGLMPVQ